MLGLPPSAQGPDIRRAYKRLALAHHPDRIAHRREKRLQRRREEQRQPPRAEEDEDDPRDARRGPRPLPTCFTACSSRSRRCSAASGKHQDDKAHSLFKVGNGGQSVSSVSADASTVAQNMGLGDEESSVASVTFTVCPMCLRPCQIGRPLRPLAVQEAQTQRKVNADHARESHKARHVMVHGGGRVKVHSRAWARRLSPWAQKDGLCSWMDA